ncbi:MAG: diaminopimelate epimerase [bacterium]
MTTLHFTKMQGTGNDFILVDGLRERIGAPDKYARFLCDRRFGIGADQVLVLLASEKADFQMQIFNADGSEVEMCGNGIRCFAKYLRDHGYTTKNVIRVETMAGIMTPEVQEKEISVDMGVPILSGPKIPVNMDGEIISEPIRLDKSDFLMTCVSMGNPHCVIKVPDVDTFPVEKIGPMIESHPLFPKRTNVEFIQVLNDHEIKMRVWERGAGETLSCGTGACASTVASALNHWTGRNILVHLKGGDLKVQWNEKGRVTLIGPAEEVFSGQIEI